MLIFFLQVHKEKFIHRARSLICEIYCMINRTVDLPNLAEKLELTEDEAEKWMVNMVRNASLSTTLDARIDSSGKQVNMSAPSKSALQDILEKTRDLTSRSTVLSNNLENLLSDQVHYVREKRIFNN